MENGIRKLRERIGQMKKNQWLILALMGVLLLVILMPLPDGQKAPETAVPATETRTEEKTENALEERLERVLGDVEGVGKVRVMITRVSDGKRIVEKDRPVTERNTSRNGDGTSEDSGEMQKEEATVYVQGEDGSQTPYVMEQMEPEIQGVLVVAEGGGEPQTVRNITDAVMALFGVEAHKIKVMKMN